jgi:hypothetical protein
MFRGMTKEGKWVEGWYVKALRTGLDARIYESHEMYIPNKGGWTEVQRVHPESVAMKTGVLDKNKKMIYGSIDIENKITRGGDIITIYHRNRKGFGNISIFRIIRIMSGWGYEFKWECIKGYACSTHIMEDDPCNFEITGTQWENKNG